MKHKRYRHVSVFAKSTENTLPDTSLQQTSPQIRKISFWEDERLTLQKGLDLTRQSILGYGANYRHWAIDYNGDKDRSTVDIIISLGDAQASLYFPRGSGLALTQLAQINHKATFSGIIPHANAPCKHYMVMSAPHVGFLNMWAVDRMYTCIKVVNQSHWYKSRAPPLKSMNKRQHLFTHQTKSECSPLGILRCVVLKSLSLNRMIYIANDYKKSRHYTSLSPVIKNGFILKTVFSWKNIGVTRRGGTSDSIG